MDKQKHLAHILKIMRRNHLTLDEVTAYVRNRLIPREEWEIKLVRFDLLCEITGKKERLPFYLGMNLMPIGIFPFEDNDIYLELSEITSTQRTKADEYRLPEHAWLAQVYPLKNELNKCLQRLGRPILDGSYFAKHHDTSARNWIVDFSDNQKKLSGDYYDSETLRLKNALPTAEGTLMLAMQNTPYVIGGSSVLVTGFGACGRQIARLFSAVGATVCVAARSPSARAEAEAQGFRSAPLENLSGIISAADIIVNTVPAKIIGRHELSSAKENALFIEIASAPFGIDEKCASELGINYVKAPALPARYAPQTSGEYIAQTVKELIEQRREGSP